MLTNPQLRATVASLNGEACMPEQASREARFDRVVIGSLAAALALLGALLILTVFAPDWAVALIP
jgi:hypothetical protein